MKQFTLPLARMLFLAILMFLITLITYAQSTKIQGKVIDAATKAPLSGVSISIKNSTVGTSTDADGNFSLEVPKNGKILASIVGYQPTEINVSQSNITIQM